MRGTRLILFASILWGTTGTAHALGPSTASPLAVGSLRLLLGAAVLVIVAVLRKTDAGWRSIVQPITFFAAIGVAAFQLFFFSAVSLTGVAVGTLLALGSGAVFVGVAEAVLSRTWPDSKWVGATAPAVVGLAILAASTRDASVDGVGVLMAIAAGASYASYIVSTSRLAQLGSIRQSTATVFSIAAIGVAPVALSQDLSFVREVDGAVMVLWLGFVTLALAYLLFSSGLRDTDPSIAGTLSLAEPVTATILGVIVLAERPGPLAWFGIALIIAGLALAARSTRRSAPAMPV